MLKIPSVVLDEQYIRSRLSYDPDTGDFTWISRGAWSPVRVGQKAGGLTGTGYVEIGLGGILVKAHRLAFLFMTGEFPPIGTDVDHINRIRNDNRWSNLRCCTRSENCHNGVNGKPQVSKRRGVRFVPEQQKWVARIMVNRKTLNLGSFVTEGEAVAARIKAERQHNLLCAGGVQCSV